MGVDAREFPGGLLRLDPAFAYVEPPSSWPLPWAECLTPAPNSHEIKRRLLLGRKVMTNLDSIVKSRDITLPTKVCLVKAMVFPVVIYGCESWTIKKVEYQKIDAFELWCWRRLKSPMDYKGIQPVNSKGNQSWIFIGRTDAEAETPILWPPDVKNGPWKRPWCWERLKAGGKGDNRGWDGWMVSLT